LEASLEKISHFEVNNNQFVDWKNIQIMQCIICHREMMGPKILALISRCHKSFIAYHTANGITTMKKHVDYDHVGLLKRYVEKANAHP
jgi:ribosomal protein S18